MPTTSAFRRLLGPAPRTRTGALAAAVALVLLGCAKDPAAPAPLAGLVVVQGADQSAQVGKALPVPIIVRAVDSTGNGIEGRTIALVIGTGGGTVTPTAGETGPTGEVTAAWTLGPGATSQTLFATAPGLEPVIISATGLVPTQVVIVQGNDQSARAGAALSTQIVIRVLGDGNVPMVGVPVAFQVTAGGGSFTPQTALTNTTGEVTVRWTLGAVAGANSAAVQVGTLDPVTLSATGNP
ncbi:MAG: hypothetical protein K1X31_02320 [Gemmatimonadaceae bacterium]|nr:hypothetical protein [Gemmatimonadaceae bacterium]